MIKNNKRQIQSKQKKNFSNIDKILLRKLLLLGGRGEMMNLSIKNILFSLSFQNYTTQLLIEVMVALSSQHLRHTTEI